MLLLVVVLAQGPRFVELKPGMVITLGHRVEYRQVDGWVELRVDIIRGSARSPGSRGPH